MGIHIDLTFDCRDATLLAEFWKLALGYEDEPPPAPYATRQEWLEAYDVPEDEWGDGAWLHDPDGVGPRLSFLGVPEAKTVKNRLHIDVRVAGEGTPEERWARMEAKAQELLAAGATELARFDGHHIVLADPEGNELCIG
ncbi:hypothetical protein KSP35_02775 [Aquihabitans sp. G128]|uniref:VOC family protein n=1 Tax=Aquihabitans sp. G128 TaxID=2849779 RepID=UPI001C2115A4|nr:VOC family protein [Aquihabitans sp. G128]QXC61780.1 hypothetical protein KSP35_02775 [Aquihabitans sp. G128]